jgi:hypothetical protein
MYAHQGRTRHAALHGTHLLPALSHRWWRLQRCLEQLAGLLQLHVPAQQLAVPQQLPELACLQGPAVAGSIWVQQRAEPVAAMTGNAQWHTACMAAAANVQLPTTLISCSQATFHRMQSAVTSC